ncbi:protein kinase [Myxococcus sp. K38C18041901]|uniref:serine/threonine-protein kinase n=1 Tax=Myxococcus guangdongensis TaxID=2906760 RepID=UPI0020A701D6|nr:serine/threonine protein kinase [Myxococcus guangdongensis]MCP3059476.1 protein kinase [Myxococcus guangdongensis]
MNAHNPSARLRPFRPQPFGRYTLLSHLATGGMGEIYLARLEGAQGFEKLCVIKKILPQLAEDTDFVERFVGEARTLVRLSHGSIAQVLDMGLHEGEAYMALEHVDGKDLRKVAARVRDRQVPLPLTFILYVMGRVLDALAYAHRKKDDDGEDLKLVHRDISPQNILISYEGEVKVIDFGLAKSRLSAAKTNPSIILGKFLYMSPEQARHQPVDRRADLYAVGLTLYELICGKNPFDGIHPGELMSVVANPKVAPLDEVEPLTPRAVTALVAKALEVDPTQRFQTAEEFRGRLQACLMEIDASAGPESVSRFMRELFTADFQSERRLLSSLKDVPRGGYSEARAASPEPSDEGAAPRPSPPAGAMLPAKTIRLDGPVEALSFHPTRRSRDGGPVDDGETRPGIPIDESTRPAFPLEALEEEARARAAKLNPDTSPSVSVEVAPEVSRPTTPPPAVAPVPRPPSQTREVPLTAMPPEAIPPAPPPPAPPPSRPDTRPTELELLPVGAVAGSSDGQGSPYDATDPRAEPLRPFGEDPRTSRPATFSGGSPRPPPPPVTPPPAAVMPQRQALVPPGAPAPSAPARSGVMMMPAVGVPPEAPASGVTTRPGPGAAMPLAGEVPASGVTTRPGPGASVMPSAGEVPASGVTTRPGPGAASMPSTAAPPPGSPARSGAMTMPPAGAQVRGGSLTSNPGVPSRSGAMSMPDTALTSNPGVPSRSGALPAQGGSLTSNPGVAARSGALPAQGGALTSNPGVPSRSGALPVQGAALTSNPGVASRSKVGEPGVVVSSLESGGDADAEMPVLTPEQMGHGEPSERLEEMDTNPRASRPGRAERYEDTHPRAPRDADTDPRGPRVADMQARAAVHEDTQPRVVLDESLLRDAEGVTRDDEERSGVSRPKTGSRRVRPSSPGMAPAQGRRTGVSRPVVVAMPEASEDEEEDADVRVSMTANDETRRTSVPSRPNVPVRRPSEDTRKTTVPKRARRSSALTWVVVLGGLGALTAGGAFLMSDPQVRGMVTNQLEQLGLVAKGPEGAPPASPVAPGAKAPKAPVEGAAEPNPGAGDTAVAEQAPVEAAAPGEQAPAPKPAAVETPPPAPAAVAETDAQKSVADDDGSLLAPLGKPTPKAPAPKRANTNRVRIIKGMGSQSELSREWKAANADLKKLKTHRSCDDLGLLCTRRDDLDEEVVAAEGEGSPDLLKRVRNFRKQVQVQLESVEQ